MYKRLLPLVLALLIAEITATAQTFTRNNVVGVSLRNSGPITQQEEVKGYFSFFDLEKKDKNNNNYQLVIFDENLREIKSLSITRPRSYAILDGAYNGSAFCFLFYDYQRKLTEMVSYDSTLQQTGSTVALVPNKFSNREYKIISQGNISSREYLTAVPGKGFIKYGRRPKGDLYQIEFFDNTMKRQWVTDAPGIFNYEGATNAFLEGDYIGSTIVSSKGSKKIETSLLVQRLEDGSKVFNIPLVTNLHSISFSKVYFDKDQQQFLVVGEYYNKNDKELKAQSLGFTTLTLDVSGKILNQRLNPWLEISQKAPITKDGKFDGSNIRMVFHDIVRTSDGQFFVIGEQYEKAISGAGIAAQGAGIALAMLTGAYVSTASSVQLNIYNMVVLQFNPDFSINRIHLFEKNKTVLSLPPGSAFTSSKQLAFYGKIMGGFDYAYTQTTSSRETFTITYIDFEKGNGNEKSSNVLGSIIYTPEKVFTVDKMKLNRASSYYYIYKAKEGYVMVTEYFKKEKRLESRLEKLNY